MDIAGERDYLNKRRLGKCISRHADRPVDGLKFVKDSSTRSAEAWRVLSVTSVISVPVPTVNETVMSSPPSKNSPNSIIPPDDAVSF